ncbi:MBOAT family protein [Prevotella sp. 10(H)]|uniref:MBOAT family O-acyltransferase n=1 Tax=Prevotella sp. 10(H) TaxID=1158294 RepID=UPI0004A7183A|nr:MBOAT family O-acyltransferase [Prevotella sp. 10(H)]
MLFDSLTFLKFLPIVFLLHWFIFSKTKSRQNIFLLLASFYFYACWDWRFLFLLSFSILINYVAALGMSNSPHKKKAILIVSLVINIGLLAFFKYYNFFIDSFNDLLSSFGVNQSLHSLYIILPVGISFYTFHGMSYIIDVYKDKIKPTGNLIDYSLFVSYFPLLVAGPIERAHHLLPQLKVKRQFNYLQAAEGLKQILWGLFKKMAIADFCAYPANHIFDNFATSSASTLLLGAFFFTIQIYCDFSGYSDIALGVSKLFGINLLKNFNYPYFSRDIAEFWRRWHISLSSWFKDYLYIPLGGSRGGTWMRVRNTFIIFLVSGFWHGANWTFIVWGGLNALFIMPSIIMRSNRKSLNTVAEGRILPSVKEVSQMLLTFVLALLAWIVFRAENMTDAVNYIVNLFDVSLFSPPEYHQHTFIFVQIIFLFVVEWFGREKNFALEQFGKDKPRYVRWAFYLILIAMIVSNMPESGSQGFIYFQF